MGTPEYYHLVSEMCRAETHEGDALAGLKWSFNMIYLYIIAATIACSAVSGCGTLANGRGWGADATLAPGWNRVGTAALKAVKAPETWAPAAGALAMQIGHADGAVSEWARTRTPLFGSRAGAGTASTGLRDTAKFLYAITFVAAPAGNEAGQWLKAKVMGGGVQLAALAANNGTTVLIKDITGRTRPDGSNTTSFPSGHASAAATYGTLGSRNIESLDLSPGLTTASQWGFGMLAASTGWARVEAGRHYPSDVLAGAALGHFFGAFFNDAFLGIENSSTVPFVEPSRNGLVVGLQASF